MFKTLLSGALACLLVIMTTSVSSFAHMQTQTDSNQADKVKATVTKLGTGKRARVEVQLVNKTRLKGYIGGIEEEHFTLVDPGHGTVTPIPYDQVQKIKSSARSSLFPLALGAAVIGGLVLFVSLVLRGS